MKIGVLSDTHVPDGMTELPARVLELFAGVDIILHAGDICDLCVLSKLEPLAQTFAVSGNCDRESVRRYLQESQRLEFANRAIGLVHGHRAWDRNWFFRVYYSLSPKARQSALHKHLLRQFSDVHAIVFGHTHEPYIKMHDGVLLFNPGAAIPGAGHSGSVGILDIKDNTIKGRVIPL